MASDDTRHDVDTLTDLAFAIFKAAMQNASRTCGLSMDE